MTEFRDANTHELSEEYHREPKDGVVNYLHIELAYDGVAPPLPPPPCQAEEAASLQAATATPVQVATTAATPVQTAAPGIVLRVCVSDKGLGRDRSVKVQITTATPMRPLFDGAISYSKATRVYVLESFNGLKGRPGPVFDTADAMCSWIQEHPLVASVSVDGLWERFAKLCRDYGKSDLLSAVDDAVSGRPWKGFFRRTVVAPDLEEMDSRLVRACDRQSEEKGFANAAIKSHMDRDCLPLVLALVLLHMKSGAERSDALNVLAAAVGGRVTDRVLDACRVAVVALSVLGDDEQRLADVDLDVSRFLFFLLRETCGVYDHLGILSSIDRQLLAMDAAAQADPPAEQKAPAAGRQPSLLQWKARPTGRLDTWHPANLRPSFGRTPEFDASPIGKRFLSASLSDWDRLFVTGFERDDVRDLLAFMGTGDFGHAVDKPRIEWLVEVARAMEWPELAVKLEAEALRVGGQLYYSSASGGRGAFQKEVDKPGK